jgi:hypothetical protein
VTPKLSATSRWRWLPPLGTIHGVLKRFLGLFRLRTFIAKETGLLAGLEHQPYAGAMTLEQRGKFTALELLWPSLLQEAERDRGLLTRLEEQAMGLRPGDSGWMSKPGVSEFLRIGCQKKASGVPEASRRGKCSAHPTCHVI